MAFIPDAFIFLHKLSENKSCMLRFIFAFMCSSQCLTWSTFELHFIGLSQSFYKGTDLLTSPSLDPADRMFFHTKKRSRSFWPASK